MRLTKHTLLLTCLLMLGLINFSQAKPVDPAPLPDEVIETLHSRLNFNESPLIQEIHAHQSDINALINQVKTFKQNKKEKSLAKAEKKTLRKSLKVALRAKAFELNQLEKRLALESEGADRIMPLRQRIKKIVNALNTLAKGKIKHKQITALQKLINSKSSSKNVSFNPTSSFKIQQPVKVKNLPISKSKPAYANWQQDDPVVIASLDNALAAVLPAAPNKTSCDWNEEDLADDARNVIITQEIKDLAKQLNYSPAKIMEWVNKEIEFVPYWGAIKGSQGVLYSKSGGPTDIASLTIALLRASNIPARYVRGVITVEDDIPYTNGEGKVQRWLGAKTYLSSGNILNSGYYPGLSLLEKGLTFAHVWVEACVPYANYRGSRLFEGGERWLPLDPSFRNPDYKAGILVPDLDIDYSTYLNERSNQLPLESYEESLNEYLSNLEPSRTSDEVGYVPLPSNLRFDVLPTSLPYQVNSYMDWSNNKPEIAKLPDIHQHRLRVEVKNSNDQSLGAIYNDYMPAIAMSRVTLSFEGKSAADKTQLRDWLLDGSLETGLPAIDVVPVIKVDGIEKKVGTDSVPFATDNHRVNMELRLDEIRNDENETIKTNEVEFTNIGAPNIHALLVDAFQVSNRLINERANQLLVNVRESNNPNVDLDAIEGEFLHIVGLKYINYYQKSIKSLSKPLGNNGLSWMTLGLASTQVKMQYAFDMPFGVNRSGYLIDIPGAYIRSVGESNNDEFYDAFRRIIYQASALESYVWQENARLDAVSTVRGLQFAKESCIPIIEFNGNSSSEVQGYNPDCPEPQVSGSTVTSGGCSYRNTSSVIQLTDSEVINRITAPRNGGEKVTTPACQINYNGWKGVVFSSESETNIRMSINSLNGGYTLPPITPYIDYNPIIDTGYNYYTPPNYSTFSDYTYTPPPAIVSPAINYGFSQYNIFSGDPVNLVNGNLYHTERDIEIKGRGGFPFVFERSYNSRDAEDGPLGYGWTHSFNHYIKFSDDNPDGTSSNDDEDNNVSSIIWFDGTGAQKSIVSNSTATTFTSPDGFYFNVSRESGSNRFLIQEKNGVKYTFESVNVSAGSIPGGRAKLVKIEDRNGNYLNVNYVGNNIDNVTDALNRSLTFYTNNNRITKITDWTGREWKYGYDSNGDLTSYENPLAASGKQPGVTYDYYTEEDGEYLAHAMQSNTMPRGNGMTFEYYINGRVFRHYPTSTPQEVTTFSYNDFRRETIVTDANGATTSHFFDRFGNPEKVLDEAGAVTTYTYDCRSKDDSDCPNPYNRLSETDPTGLTIEYEYDAQGNQIKTKFPASGNEVWRTDFASNTYGQPRRIRDARGNWKIVRYDTKGNITDEIQLKAGIVPASCGAGECAIPAAANIALWTKREFDAYGNTTLVKRIRDFNSQTGPTLATNWNDTVNNVTGLNSVRFTRTGDKDGNGSIDAADIANHSYDSLGRVKTGIDRNWYSVSVLEYDAVNRPVKQLDVLGHYIETDYDANGNLEEKRVYKSDRVTLLDKSTTVFDENDRAKTRTDNAGNTTELSYDLLGNLKTSTNPDGYRVEMVYDSQGHVVEALDEERLLTVRDYDVAGRLQSITNPVGISQTFTYHDADQGGRIKRSQMPAIQDESIGRAFEQDYDANGNVIRSRTLGSNGSVRENFSFYDAQNRLVRQVSPIMDAEANNQARRQVCYVYSNLGDLTELWIGETTNTTSNTCNFADTNLKKQVTYLYNDFGYKVRETDPLNKSWNWKYDVHGNVLEQTDAKNQKTTFKYKNSGLLETRTDHAGQVTTWTYYDLGLLKTVGDANVTYTYTYDDAHRVKSVNNSRGNKTISYDYSPGGLLNTMTDAEDRNTDYIYDNVGRLTGLWLPNGDYFNWGYNEQGLLTTKWSDTGNVTDYVWNEDGSLRTVSNFKDNSPASAPNLVSTHYYRYDEFGRPHRDWAFVEGVGQQNQCTTRTALGQIKKWHHSTSGDDPCESTPKESYAYDVFGNRTEVVNYSLNPTEVLFLSSYDAAQQLERIDAYQVNGGVRSFDGTHAQFGYDDNGSMTSKIGVTGTLTMVWDELNRLEEVEKGGSGLLTGNPTKQRYTYDPYGRRINKQIVSGQGTSTAYLFDGNNAYAEYTTGWTQPTTINNYQGVDQSIAKLSLNNGVFGDAHYLHTEMQGNAEVVTKANDNGEDVTVGQLVRNPWGNAIVSVSPNGLANLQRLTSYQGRQGDETGLINFRARYLSTGENRFISRDPKGFAGGINAYVAFENDPLTYSDPAGTSAVINSGIAAIDTSYFGSLASQADQWNRQVEQWFEPPQQPTASYQNLNTVQYRQSPHDSSFTVQTALDLASAIPVVGTFTSLASAAIDYSEGRNVSGTISVLSAIPFVGTVGTTAKVGFKTADALLDTARVANSGSTTLFRSVSKGELDDIAVNGLRTTSGGYETGKLFATSLDDATRFGKNNFKLDGVPNHLIKVDVPNSVMKDALRFRADSMDAISIPANQLNRLNATPLNFSPLVK